MKMELQICNFKIKIEKVKKKTFNEKMEELARYYADERNINEFRANNTR